MDYTKEVTNTILMLLFGFQNNSYHYFLKISHHCLLGEVSPLLILLWPDAYLMTVYVNSRHM